MRRQDPIFIFSLALVLFAIFGGAPASADTAEIQALRSATEVRRQLIDVGNGCRAFSQTASSRQGYLITWEGGCFNGYAQGQGIQRIWALGEPLQTLLGNYEAGQWIVTLESYTVSKGVIIKSGPIPGPLVFTDQKVEPMSVPEWAKDIVNQQPISLAAWKNDVARRLSDLSKTRGDDSLKNNSNEDSDEKSEMELLFEVKLKDSEDAPGSSATD